MLVSLGTTAGGAPETLVGLLTACHARIRRFGALAVELATRPGLGDAEARDAAARCHRYFSRALPLHVRDEEDSLVPRLVGREPALDAMLAQMAAQHAQHGPLLAAFLEALARCEASPGDTAARATLARLAAPLAADFEAHLRQEEAVLFPAIERLLSADAQAAAIVELRGRRASA